MGRQHNKFPNTLRLHRKTLGYTQRQVATLLDLHDSVPISLWEKGAVLPSTINLIRLSLIYRTYPNELYRDLFSLYRKALQEKEGAVLGERFS